MTAHEILDIAYMILTCALCFLVGKERGKKYYTTINCNLFNDKSKNNCTAEEGERS